MNTEQPLPPGWRWVRLGDCGELAAGVTLGRRLESQCVRAVPYLRVANVKDGHIDLRDVATTPASAAEVKSLALKRGDLLLTEGGDADKLGRGAVWEGQLPECIHQNHIFRLRIDAARMEPAFVAFQVASPHGRAYFMGHAKQTTGIATINQRVLRDLPLMLPPLAEQRRIAAMLNAQMAAVDQARAAAEARLEAVKALPAALLREVFPRDASDAPDGWRTLPLGECGEVRSGVTLGRRIEGAGVRSVPYLRVANVKDGYLDLCDVAYTPATAEEIAALVLRRGDILLTEGGDADKLGRGTVWDDQLPGCIHQNHIFRVRISADSADPAFVALQAGAAYGKAYFLRHAKQTTGIATINQRVLKAFPLLMPPLLEQRRLAALLNAQMAAVEQARAAAEAELEAIKALPAALLRRAFSGEL
ncbi:MAG: hypothetical protein GX595_09615 [Lentisphaerae bacterium]|nr:hypothetical protein [Lentisphaerota bacterium]